MSLDDFGLLAALFAGACLLAAIMGLHMGNVRSDVALLGGSGVVLGVASAFLYAL